MFKRIKETLGFGKMGFSEFLILLVPILNQYPYYLGLIALILVAIFNVSNGKRPVYYKPLLYFIIFLIVHDIALSVILFPAPQYFINRSIVTILSLLLIFYIVPHIDFEKFYHSAIFIGYICVIGLVYHFVSIYFYSRPITPISLPFLPPINGEYFLSIGGADRPTSFFAEPASYATYMIVPLFMCSLKKNYLTAIIITISILLSSSTNGYAMVCIIWMAFLFLDSKLSTRSRIILFLGGIGLIYLVLYSGYFEQGLNKIMNTNTSDDVRMTSGIYLFQDIPWVYKIFGIDAANVYDFLQSHRNIISGQYVLGISDENKSVYLPVFWDTFICYGIVGMLLYLNCYFSFRRIRSLIPLLLTLFISTFVQSIQLFNHIIMLLVISNYILKQEDRNIETI